MQEAIYECLQAYGLRMVNPDIGRMMNIGGTTWKKYIKKYIEDGNGQRGEVKPDVDLAVSE